jgi:hypothetical protein
MQSVRERQPELYETEGELDLTAFVTQSPAAMETLATAIYNYIFINTKMKRIDKALHLIPYKF